MTDQERLDFIKKRIKYLELKLVRANGKTQLIDDFMWLIEKAEIEIKERNK